MLTYKLFVKSDPCTDIELPYSKHDSLNSKLHLPTESNYDLFIMHAELNLPSVLNIVHSRLLHFVGFDGTSFFNLDAESNAINGSDVRDSFLLNISYQNFSSQFPVNPDDTIFPLMLSYTDNLLVFPFNKIQLPSMDINELKCIYVNKKAITLTRISLCMDVMEYQTDKPTIHVIADYLRPTILACTIRGVTRVAEWFYMETRIGNNAPIYHIDKDVHFTNGSNYTTTRLRLSPFDFVGYNGSYLFKVCSFLGRYSCRLSTQSHFKRTEFFIDYLFFLDEKRQTFSTNSYVVGKKFITEAPKSAQMPVLLLSQRPQGNRFFVFNSKSKYLNAYYGRVYKSSRCELFGLQIHNFSQSVTETSPQETSYHNNVKMLLKTSNSSLPIIFYISIRYIRCNHNNRVDPVTFECDECRNHVMHYANSKCMLPSHCEPGKYGHRSSCYNCPIGMTSKYGSTVKWDCTYNKTMRNRSYITKKVSESDISDPENAWFVILVIGGVLLTVIVFIIICVCWSKTDKDEPERHIHGLFRVNHKKFHKKSISTIPEEPESDEIDFFGIPTIETIAASAQSSAPAPRHFRGISFSSVSSIKKKLSHILSFGHSHDSVAHPKHNSLSIEDVAITRVSSNMTDEHINETKL